MTQIWDVMKASLVLALFSMIIYGAFADVLAPQLP